MTATKKILTIALIISNLSFVNAQSFVKGQKDLNIGVGAGNRYVNSFYNSSSPALVASLEFAVTDEISLGGFLGYTGGTYKTGNYYTICGGNYVGPYYDTYRYSYSVLGFRAAYHFAKYVAVDKLDLYAGLMLGSAYASVNFSSTAPCNNTGLYSSGSVFAYSFYAGLRYRFNDKIGLYTELGYGMSYFSFGVNFKFGGSSSGSK